MSIRPLYATLGTFLLIATLFPATSFAASSRPSCTLRVTTPAGTDSTKRDMEVLAVSGQAVTVEWAGKNAQSALSGGESVPVQGSSTFVVSESQRLSYKFKGGSKTVTCEADLELVKATVNQASDEDGVKVSLSGRADNIKALRVDVKRGNDTVASSKVKAKRDKWQLTLKNRLDDGTYDVVVFGAEGDLRNQELARGTLRSGKVPATTLSASPISLLFGGTARAGTATPVAYVQLRNTGVAPATISGFDLRQNGNAPNASVIGFTTADDKGGSLSTVTGTFQNGTVFVPLAATILPGQFKIFTLKALVAGNAGAFSGTQLRIDVDGVRTDATVTGLFPMRGTTWTLAY